MKIAFLNKYQGKVNRGAETFVSEMAKRLSKNHEVAVLTSTLALLSKKYDLIIPTNGRAQAIFTRFVAFVTGAKVIISGQSGIGFDDRVNLYTFPDVFVGLSEYQCNWAKKINPYVKVLKIPNGVDLSEFKASRSNRKVILSVGAFTKEKRHDLTIKAVSKLEGVHLLIVGSGGNEKGELEALGRKLLGNRFEVLSVPHSKMPDIYEKAGVLAFPTVSWESFGIVIVEAMASGLAVVANDDPIRREIVGDAGIFVDPTDTASYASALQKALDTDFEDKPRRQAEKFSWDKIAAEYDKTIERITNKK